MNRRSKILLIVAFGGFGLIAKQFSGAQVKEQAKIKLNPTKQITGPGQIARLPSAINSSLTVPSTDNESLDNMLKTLSRYTQTGQKLPDLLNYLKDNGEGPLVSRDRNPYTGEMTIVRTNSPLPGTRYFHAQYFSNETGEPFVQHMSFEYKPSPTAMTEVVSLVEKSFSNLGEPTVREDNYVQWNLGEDHIVWVKKMAIDDLKDDPFNSYSPDDVGTIRVAVELEIHEREQGH